MKTKTNEVIKMQISKLIAVRSHLVDISTDDLTRDEYQSLSDAMSSIEDAIDILTSMED